MSINVLVCLDAYCDGCQRGFGESDDEPANSPGLGQWKTTAQAARRDMKTYDWKTVRRDGRLMDLCPTCAIKK